MRFKFSGRSGEWGRNLLIWVYSDKVFEGIFQIFHNATYSDLILTNGKIRETHAGFHYTSELGEPSSEDVGMVNTSNFYSEGRSIELQLPTWRSAIPSSEIIMEYRKIANNNLLLNEGDVSM